MEPEFKEQTLPDDGNHLTLEIKPKTVNKAESSEPHQPAVPQSSEPHQPTAQQSTTGKFQSIQPKSVCISAQPINDQTELQQTINELVPSLTIKKSRVFGMKQNLQPETEYAKEYGVPNIDSSVKVKTKGLTLIEPFPIIPAAKSSNEKRSPHGLVKKIKNKTEQMNKSAKSTTPTKFVHNLPIRSKSSTCISVDDFFCGTEPRKGNSNIPLLKNKYLINKSSVFEAKFVKLEKTESARELLFDSKLILDSSTVSPTYIELSNSSKKIVPEKSKSNYENLHQKLSSLISEIDDNRLTKSNKAIADRNITPSSIEAKQKYVIKKYSKSSPAEMKHKEKFGHANKEIVLHSKTDNLIDPPFKLSEPIKCIEPSEKNNIFVNRNTSEFPPLVWDDFPTRAVLAKVNHFKYEY